MRTIAVLTIALSFACGALPSYAAPLVTDNFNDGILDPAKWTAFGTAAGSSAVEQNGRFEFTNRGYLVSAAQFNPNDSLFLRVAGIWTINDTANPAHDILDVITRSDGVPFGGFHEVFNGIDFQLNGAGVARVTKFVDGAATLLGSIQLEIDSGDSFFFEIIDIDLVGMSLFTVTEIGGEGASAALFLDNTDQAYAAHHVVFHNREQTHGSHTAYLDNVVIEAHSIPEPATLWLAAVGALGLLLVRALRNGPPPALN